MSQHAANPVVFVVDDHDSMLRSLTRMLTLAGYAVSPFGSAAEFLARHRADSRGCVIADLRMPVMNGLELQMALARSGNPLPVIFLTGHGDIPTSVHAMKRGAEDFLTKPPQKERLLPAIERALASDAAAFARQAQQRELRRQFELLTPREREVLDQIAAGKLNKQIAADLGAAENTIKAHRANIMEKFQVRSPVELGRITQELASLPPTPDPPRPAV
jgi:FixJ family two-component response regulator